MSNPFKFIVDLIDPPSNRKIRQQIVDNWEELNTPWQWQEMPIGNYISPTIIAAKYFRHTSTAQIPTYAKDLDAGADLYADIEAQIEPGKVCLISTGLSIVIPAGFEMQIRPRSGMAFKHGITVLNSPGTIDAGYKGIIGVLLYNTSDRAYQVDIGDRIAQAVFAPVARAEFQQLSPIEFQDIDTDRGVGGFGSSGKH